MNGGAGPTLFDLPIIGRARARDPETAKAAARGADAHTLSGQVVRLLEQEPAAAGGLTSEELAERLGRDRLSVSPRLKPLVEKGLVRDSGRRRGTRLGRKAIVWEVVRDD